MLFPIILARLLKKTLFNALDLCRTRRRLNNPAVGPGQPWLVTTDAATTGDEDGKDDKRKTCVSYYIEMEDVDLRMRY